MPPSVASDDQGAGGDKGPAWTGAPYGKPEVTVTKTEAGFDVTVNVRQRDGMVVPKLEVPFTAERYKFELKTAAGELSEANVFGSGLAMDVDGDGAKTSTLPVTCEGSVVRVGETGVPPISLGGDNSYVYRSTSGDPKVTRMGEEGAWVVLYNPCDKQPVSVGFCPPDETMDLKTVAGPVLQLLVIEQAAGPGLKPTFSIADVTLGNAKAGAEEYTTYIYDGTSDTPVWHTSVWMMVPLDASAAAQTATLRVVVPEGEPVTRMVMAAVSASPAVGERRRLPPAVKPLQ